jgi:diacylglycerol kinase family enzyme
VNNSSIGIYPSIVERREQLRRQGHRKWLAFARATAEILARADEVSVRLNVAGTHVVTRTPFVFVGNNEYQVEGIHMGARARLDSGRLVAYLAPRVKTRELPKLVVLALVGRAGRRDAFATLSETEIWIETLDNRRVSVSTDGEVAHMVTPLHYRSMPRALTVFVPMG